jgi:hypothetical protein
MKKLFFGFFGLVIILLTVSCATAPINKFDEELPLEQSALLKIMEYMTVRSYNGIDVRLEQSTSLFPMAFTNFAIPPGRATLVMNLYVSTGSSMVTVYRASNIPLTYDFEAGETYRIIFSFTDDDKNMTASGNIPAIILVKEPDARTPLLMIQLQRQADTVLE